MARIHSSSRSESGWPIALIALAFGSFAVGVTPTGNRICKEFTQSLLVKKDRPIALARPDVLLVGNIPSDQLDVATTIAPRGYNLVLAESVPAGLARLHSHADRIALIVLDSRLEKVGVVEQMAQLLSPEARIITLRRRHTTEDIVGLVRDSIQN